MVNSSTITCTRCGSVVPWGPYCTQCSAYLEFAGQPPWKPDAPAFDTDDAPTTDMDVIAVDATEQSRRQVRLPGGRAEGGQRTAPEVSGQFLRRLRLHRDRQSSGGPDRVGRQDRQDRQGRLKKQAPIAQWESGLEYGRLVQKENACFTRRIRRSVTVIAYQSNW